MGRRPWSSRLTVEECPISLCAAAFQRSGMFTSSSGPSWTVSWTDSRGVSLGCVDVSVGHNGPTGLAIEVYERGVWLNWHYTLLERQSIPVSTTQPYLGGKRFWFLCPTIRNGRRCGRRVGRLYLPRGQQIFGCRHCHNLTYKSAREHDHRRYLLARDLSAMDDALRSKKHRRALLGVSAWRLSLEWLRKRQFSRFVSL